MTQGKRWLAWAGIFALVGLAVWAFVAPASQPVAAGSADDSDIALYRAIVDRMREGAGYYGAVAAEQPGRGYPVAPAPAVREPTLAWLISTLGTRLSYAILVLLGIGAVLVTVQALDRLKISRIEWMLASVVAAVSVAWFCLPSGLWFHDVWAGLLLLMGVMASLSGRWRLAIGAVLLAALVRELAAPVIVITAVLAWRRGRRTEALAWCVAGLAFAAYYAWHVVEVFRLPPGPIGPGWLAGGGWPFSAEAIRFSSLLRAVPPEVAAIMVPCALLGWIVARREGTLLLAVLICYLSAFMVVGRPDNAYWGALVALLLMPGLVFAPRALTRLAHLARKG